MKNYGIKSEVFLDQRATIPTTMKKICENQI